jgi:hypothetical protein
MDRTRRGFALIRAIPLPVAAIVPTTILDDFPATPNIDTEHAALRRLALAGAGMAALLLAAWLCRAWLKLLSFDDAYMFYRYAVNIAHGLGISWNPDGVHTYGMTSQLWVFLILPMTALPFTPGHVLQLASWLAGCAALMTMTLTVVRHARSTWLQSMPVAFAAVALPLAGNPIFAYHLTTGMDTMVAVCANALVVFGILEYVARPSLGLALRVGVLSFIAVLARPDSGLCALGAPLLVWLTLPGSRRWRDLVGLCVLPLVLVGADLVVCKEYFQVPFPLGFYAKSVHGYAGFLSQENAVTYAYMAALCAVPFAGALAATLTRRQRALVVALLLPAAATVAYLLTVRQVMGFVGRYYIPLLPFMVIPALLSVDTALVERVRPARRIVFGVALAALAYLCLRPIEIGWEKQYVARVVPAPIPVPALPVQASGPLPVFGGKWFPVNPVIARLVAALPPGATVAASEVGYLACISPHANIIDLVGLNDTRIGMQGFSMDDLMERAPDLIWLPHTAYTGLRATMFADPRLFSRYIVIADIFYYGIAIRRDSPMRGAIEQGVRAAWSTLYPTWRMTDYVVSQRYTPATQSRPQPSS